MHFKSQKTINGDGSLSLTVVDFELLKVVSKHFASEYLFKSNVPLKAKYHCVRGVPTIAL